MILERSIRLKRLPASLTIKRVIRLIQDIESLCNTMLSHKVDEAISICQRLKRAAIDWTLQKWNNALNLHSWVLSSDMKLKTLPRKTLILAVSIWTLMGEVALTLSTMHIHGGRETLLNTTVGADILASLITLVRESHCTPSTTVGTSILRGSTILLGFTILNWTFCRLYDEVRMFLSVLAATHKS